MGYMTMSRQPADLGELGPPLEGESSVLLVGSTLGIMMVLTLLRAILQRFRVVRARLAQMHA
jgi:hypothetical protein